MFNKLQNLGVFGHHKILKLLTFSRIGWTFASRNTAPFFATFSDKSSRALAYIHDTIHSADFWVGGLARSFTWGAARVEGFVRRASFVVWGLWDRVYRDADGVAWRGETLDVLAFGAFLAGCLGTSWKKRLRREGEELTFASRNADWPFWAWGSNASKGFHDADFSGGAFDIGTS